LKKRKNRSSNDFSQRRKLSSDQAQLGSYSLAEDMFIKTQIGKIGQLTKLPGNQYKKRSQDGNCDHRDDFASLNSRTIARPFNRITARGS
jgi:hypothetical protein